MSEPLTVAQLKNKVDQDVTTKVTRKSITPLILGNLLKTIIDFCINFFIPASAKGAANGVASLGNDGKVPTSQLPEGGVGGSSSSLFPNGIKIVTEDYAFQASDAGKIIYISGNEITVGFDYEAPNPFKKGDYVGVIDAGSIVDGSTGNAVIYSLNNDPIQMLPVTFAESQAAESEILTIINQDSPANDGSVISTVLGGVIEGKTSAKYFYDKSQNANSYSTDEIKTGGTWIDGKPIYRKTFTSIINSVNQTIPFDNTGIIIRKIETLFGDINNDGVGTFNSFFAFTDSVNYTDIRAYYFQDDLNFIIINRKANEGVITPAFTNAEIYITIEYTKTTD